MDKNAQYYKNLIWNSKFSASKQVFSTAYMKHMLQKLRTLDKKYNK